MLLPHLCGIEQYVLRGIPEDDQIRSQVDDEDCTPPSGEASMWSFSDQERRRWQG
jgi:hypothetical protein